MTRPNITPGTWISVVPPSSCQTHRFIEATRKDEPSITLAEVGGLYSSGSMPGAARTSISQHTANAKAIAAVPALLEALEIVDEAFSKLPDYGEAFTRPNGWSVQPLAKVRSALIAAGYQF